MRDLMDTRYVYYSRVIYYRPVWKADYFYLPLYLSTSLNIDVREINCDKYGYQKSEANWTNSSILYEPAH